MNMEQLKRNDRVVLNRNATPLSGVVFKKGDAFKFLGWHGSLLRLSRVGDNAKLMVLPNDIEGYVEPTPPPAKPAPSVRDIYDAPHSDESGPSRFVVTATVLAGKDSGTIGMNFTPAEEAEYNRGMAMMAQLG